MSNIFCIFLNFHLCRNRIFLGAGCIRYLAALTKYLFNLTFKIIFKFQGFTLHFHFAPNDYFYNKVLTKEYEMIIEPGEDGEIFQSMGCTIGKT